MESVEALAKKMRSFSLTKFAEGFDAVILGHCHEPLCEEYIVDGQKKTFAALGDWIGRYTYLYYEDGHFILSHYRPHDLLPEERRRIVSETSEVAG